MASDRAIRVMIVDDHADVRSGLRLSLLAFDDLELVAEAANCQEALAECDRLRDREALPDVILMDMLMPGADGAATTQAILDCHSEVRVIALASFDTEMLVEDALRAGAVGYVLKGAAIDELAEAIRAAHAGRATPAPAAHGRAGAQSSRGQVSPGRKGRSG
jgi:NarL family two-component system response regulator LiaR